MNFHVASALVEAGESMKQLADVKYSLDDNVKQNFLEPLHHLQSKDLKEVMVRRHAGFTVKQCLSYLIDYLASPEEASRSSSRFRLQEAETDERR